LEGEEGYRLTARARPPTGPPEVAAAAPDLPLSDLVLDGGGAGLTFLAVGKGDKQRPRSRSRSVPPPRPASPPRGGRSAPWVFAADRLVEAMRSSICRGEGDTLALGS